MKRVLLSLLCLIGTMSLWGQSYERLSTFEENLFGRNIYVSGSYDAMKQVRQYWNNEFSRLKNDKYSIAFCGNGEAVLKVTIPVRLLFKANEPSLQAQADGMLRPFLRFLRGRDATASLVIACHSDNNGSARYLNEMTLDRANEIQNWMQKQGVTAKVHTYGVGSNVPLNDNASISEREENRRVSFYLVPNKQMMKLAKKQKLIN